MLNLSAGLCGKLAKSGYIDFHKYTDFFSNFSRDVKNIANYQKH